MPSSTSEYFSITHKYRNYTELVSDWVFGNEESKQASKRAAEKLYATIKTLHGEGLKPKQIAVHLTNCGRPITLTRVYNILYQLGLRTRKLRTKCLG